MIDWWFVGINFLWILGASIVLSAVSYHHWVASETGRKFMQVARDPKRGRAYDAGTILFCVGWMFGQVEPLWQRGLWGLMVVWVVWLGIMREKTVRAQRAQAAAATAAEAAAKQQAADATPPNPR